MNDTTKKNDIEIEFNENSIDLELVSVETLSVFISPVQNVSERKEVV